MLLSHSVNSVSSIPSPVNQCKKAFLLNITVNYQPTLLNNSLTAVVLPTNVLDIFIPLGGISHKAVMMLCGMKSMKQLEFLAYMFIIYSSTSLVDVLPLNTAMHVRYLPLLGSQAAIMFLLSNIYQVSSGTLKALQIQLPLDVSGAKPEMKKCILGNGTRFVMSLRRSAFN